jgi:hypothetical protein
MPKLQGYPSKSSKKIVKPKGSKSMKAGGKKGKK